MIAHLQALRFVAAFWVVLFHAQPPLVPADALPAAGAAWHALAGMGFFGVDLFFVISGAVMAESTRHAKRGPGTFLLRRCSRIYAGWWPFFLLYLLANHLYRGLGQRDLLGSFLLLPLSLERYLVPIVWTLSLELWFYLVLAALLHLPRRVQRHALLAWGLVALSAAAWGLHHGLFSPDAPAPGLLPNFFLSPFVAEFVAGFLLCEWLRERPAPAWWAWLLAGLGALALGAAWHLGGDLQHAGLSGWYHAPDRVLLLGTAALGIVAAALLAPPPRAAWHGYLVQLGDASYSLYLGHILFLGTAWWVLARLGLPSEARGVTHVLLLAGVVAFSWLFHRLVEFPLYRGVLRLAQVPPRALRASP